MKLRFVAELLTPDAAGMSLRVFKLLGEGFRFQKLAVSHVLARKNTSIDFPEGGWRRRMACEYMLPRLGSASGDQTSSDLKLFVPHPEWLRQ
jgi:hypothetical protein